MHAVTMLESDVNMLADTRNRSYNFNPYGKKRKKWENLPIKGSIRT